MPDRFEAALCRDDRWKLAHIDERRAICAECPARAACYEDAAHMLLGASRRLRKDLACDQTPDVWAGHTLAEITTHLGLEVSE